MSEMDILYREPYINKIFKLKDNNKVKIILGPRKVGKTSLINQLISYFTKHKINKENIIHIDLDDIRFINLRDHANLYNLLSTSLNHNTRTYLFIDEIFKISDFNKTINTIIKDFNVDLYLTNSNNYVLEQKIDPEIDIINLQPLSFKENINYIKKLLSNDENNTNTDLNIMELFDNYITRGGMTSACGNNCTNTYSYLETVYSTIAVKDILQTNKSLDFNNLDLIFKYICRHVGESLSNNNIAIDVSQYLKEKNFDPKINIAVKTVNKYIELLANAFLIHPVQRIDIRSGKKLKTIGKNYIFDTGLRNSIVGYKNSDKLPLIENIVYLELIRRGYTVHIGKVYDYEITFIAEIDNETHYIQVTDSIINETSREKALKPFNFINNLVVNKIVITLDINATTSFNDIKVYNIIDWLISKK